MLAVLLEVSVLCLLTLGSCMILRITSSILGTFLCCFLFPFLSSYLGIMFQVEIGGEVMGKGIGLTWDEAKMQVIYLIF